MNHHDDSVQFEAERCGRLLVVEFGDTLDFEEVVAGPERPELLDPTLFGHIREFRRVARQSAVLLAVFEVVVGGVAVVAHPAHPVAQNPLQVVEVDGDDPTFPRPRRNQSIQFTHEVVLDTSDVVVGEVRPEQSDATVDVEADAAGADDAGLHVDGGDATDGEAVPLVTVGHHDGEALDTRQGRDVPYLLERLVTRQSHLVQQGLGGVDACRYAHLAGAFDLVDVRVELCDCWHSPCVTGRCSF